MESLFGDSAKRTLLKMIKKGKLKQSDLDTPTEGWFIAMGYESGDFLTTGKRNIFIGYSTGGNVTTAEINVFVGHESGFKNTSGYQNSFLGYRSGYEMTEGYKNTCIGSNAGDNLTTGDNNTCLGHNSDASSATVNNEITLGDSSVATLRCNTQTISSLSDGRDKTDIVDLPIGLDFINKLKPRKFKWETRDGNIKDGTVRSGFIAQELQEAQIDCDYVNLVLDENPDKLEASEANLIPVLVQAVK